MRATDVTPTPEQVTELAREGVLALGLTVGLVVALAVALLRASTRAPHAMVVVSLSLLTLIALLGYAIGGEARPELAAIAGTAMGALAGATTSLLSARREDAAAPPAPAPPQPPPTATPEPPTTSGRQEPPASAGPPSSPSPEH